MSGSKSSDRAEASAAASEQASAEPLTLSVHGMSPPDLAEPVQAAQRRTRLGRAKMLLVLLVCAAPVVASYLSYYVIRPEGRSNYSTLMQPSRTLPDLPLRSLGGSPVPAQSLRGQWLLVSVGPAACGADCEKRLYMQRQLREMLGRESGRLDKVWFITDDAQPAPALIKVLERGEPVTALRVPREALAAWLAPASGQQLEDHLYLVDPHGEWMLRMPPKADPARVKRDLDRVLRASASWDQPGR